jgi:hypothetical protein
MSSPKRAQLDHATPRDTLEAQHGLDYGVHDNYRFEK